MMQISDLNPGMINILKQKAALEFCYLPKKPQCKGLLSYYKLHALQGWIDCASDADRAHSSAKSLWGALDFSGARIFPS